jgi:hypothetical protein
MKFEYHMISLNAYRFLPLYTLRILRVRPIAEAFISLVAIRFDSEIDLYVFRYSGVMAERPFASRFVLRRANRLVAIGRNSRTVLASDYALNDLTKFSQFYSRLIYWIQE